MRSRLASLGLLALSCLACTPAQTSSPSAPPPTLEPSEPNLRPPSVALPMHDAPILGVELLPPQAGEQWRLVSADKNGWVRIWADGQMLAAWLAHRGGCTDLRQDLDGSFYTAGRDGRVLRWPAGATAPDQALRLGRPITALALANLVIAISDGKSVELWTRDEQPKRVWQMMAHGFVAGLEISRGGDIIAAASLRQSALTSGLANHPDAPFIEAEALGLDEAAQQALREQAELERPEAMADLVEVWQPGLNRARQLVPLAPIDRELGIQAAAGVVIYREIHGRDHATLVGRRLSDLSTAQLQLVKPWAFWNMADGNPDARGQGPSLPAGDFRMGPKDEVVILDHFPGWDSVAPPYGWRVGEGRELALSQHHAAVGDRHGNLAVVAWARPAEAGWLAPGETKLDLLTSAAKVPRLVTATLEPRTHYRLWDFAAGGTRNVRVEQPWFARQLDESGEAVEVGPPMFPTRMALDAAGELLATGNSSYGAEAQVALRLIELASARTNLLHLQQGSSAELGFELGLSQDAAHLLAWLPGSPALTWSVQSDGEWLPGRPAFGGVPRFSPNGLWSAHLSGLERKVVDLRARKATVALTNDQPSSDLGADSLAALGDDGSVALVQPFGADTLERISPAGERTRVELPGAATALAAVTTREGQTVSVIGFADGSIARLDPGAELAEPIHAGAGGRVWELAALPSAPGVFVELDEHGLTLHRLEDGASLELHLADTGLLRTWQPGQPVSSEGLFALWRGGSAQPPCRVLDGSGAGVLSRDPLEAWTSERAAELFAAFLAGEPCSTEPEPEQQLDAEAEADAEAEPEAGSETPAETPDPPKDPPAPVQKP